MSLNAELRTLSAGDGRDVYNMLQEIPLAENGLDNPCHGKDYAAYQAWLRQCVNEAAGIGLQAGYVPQSVFWLYADGRPVGMGKVRHFLTDRLLRHGGNIGYGIRPSARGRGYGSLLLSLLLDSAKSLGIGRALITVNIDNQPSLRAILSNGARIENTLEGQHRLWAPTSLSKRLKNALGTRGAQVVGFADLAAVPEALRQGYPRGISMGLAWDRAALEGIADEPTPHYHANYNELNERLDALTGYAERWLQLRGHRALGKTREVVAQTESGLETLLPHKTVATRAGVGWIGKCALLVTPDFGPAVRLTSVLTDAPLETATPMDTSRCGECTACQSVCPAGAVSGQLWHVGIPREAFFDASACRKAARERSAQALRLPVSLCGLCILHCPWTRRYWRRAGR